MSSDINNEVYAVKEKRKIPWSTIYLVVTILAVLVFGILNNQIGNVFETLSKLSPQYMLVAIAAIIAFFFLEGGIIHYLLKSQGEKLRFRTSMKIGLIGIYYSYITPSSTGGQPAQVAYLKRDDDVSVGSSVAALFVKFFAYQASFVFLTVVSFIFMWKDILATKANLIPFIWIGIAINSIWIILIPLLFSKTILTKMCRFANRLLEKMKFLKKRESYQEHVLKFQDDFTDYTRRFRKKKGSVLNSILLSIPQVILQMCVLYLIFLSFGYTQFSFFEITSMQTLLQSTVCFMPMPGASGAQEIGFSTFFNGYFTNNDLYTAVMVWRFFTYYIVVLAGAGLIVVDELRNRKKRREKLRNL